MRVEGLGFDTLRHRELLYAMNALHVSMEGRLSTLKLPHYDESGGARPEAPTRQCKQAVGVRRALEGSRRRGQSPARECALSQEHQADRQTGRGGHESGSTLA